jgi:hypothetical protein
MLGPAGGASGVLAGGTDCGEVGVPPCGGWGLWGGADAQPASVPTIASHIRSFVMTLIVLEALGALLLLMLIVWWTMFSGRKKGEPRRDADAPSSDDAKK